MIQPDYIKSIIEELNALKKAHNCIIVANALACYAKGESYLILETTIHDAFDALIQSNHAKIDKAWYEDERKRQQDKNKIETDYHFVKNATIDYISSIGQLIPHKIVD